jgi:hypothetical protein
LRSRLTRTGRPVCDTSTRTTTISFMLRPSSAAGSVVSIFVAVCGGRSTSFSS